MRQITESFEARLREKDELINKINKLKEAQNVEQDSVYKTI